MDDDDRPPRPEHRDFPAVLERGLQDAAALGLVEITEAGMFDWDYLDALQVARDRAGALPCRVRLLVASGLAEADPKRLVSTGDQWVDVIGVKFYADGWLGPRTCAVREPFLDRLIRPAAVTPVCSSWTPMPWPHGSIRSPSAASRSQRMRSAIGPSRRC